MFVLLSLAIALSLDAFSIALSIGIYEQRINKHLFFSLLVGIFHFIMPVLGSLTSQIFLKNIIMNGNKLLGIILLVLAFQMIIELKDHKEKEISKNSFVILALAVSIDSYFTAVGLNKAEKIDYLNYLMFSICSFIFSYMGCKIGLKAKSIFNNLANYLGIVILLIIGVKYLFM